MTFLYIHSGAVVVRPSSFTMLWGGFFTFGGDGMGLGKGITFLAGLLG